MKGIIYDRVVYASTYIMYVTTMLYLITVVALFSTGHATAISLLIPTVLLFVICGGCLAAIGITGKIKRDSVCYSYAMGVSEEILLLPSKGFYIAKTTNDNYEVTFSKEYAKQWEDFIHSNLQVGFWNEYLVGRKAIFIFHVEGGFKKYIVTNYKNDVVLGMCRNFAKADFESLKAMLTGNEFYKKEVKYL